MIAVKNHLFYAEPRAIKQGKYGYTYQIGRYAIYNIAKELKKGYKLAIFRLKPKDTHFAHLISKFEEVSNKIINEIPGINRVAYDVSRKPASTIEWE